MEPKAAPKVHNRGAAALAPDAHSGQLWPHHLSCALAIWDERPWTDLPKRLRRVEGLSLVGDGGEGGGASNSTPDVMLIIRRWPTAVVVRRLAAVVAKAPMPVLLCTAAPSDICAKVLRLGVADIVRDDMHCAEIVARLALRCGRGNGMQVAFGPLLLDRMQRLAWCNGRMVRVTPLQLDLLATLMAAGGEAVQAEALRQAVWHNARDTGTNRLAVHIHHIRRALHDAGGEVGVVAQSGGYALVLEQPA